MSPVIRISDELYTRLEQHAEGFDTPANVIERLLDTHEEIPIDERKNIPSPIRRRDITKYSFNGDVYGKARLVHAVIAKHVTNHPEITYQQLQNDFPKNLQDGNLGVFNELNHVMKKFSEFENKRHYVKPDEVIPLSDKTITVCTQWGIGNIDRFIEHAKKLGHEITIETLNTQQ